jgi:hypothetical protein
MFRCLDSSIRLTCLYLNFLKGLGECNTNRALDYKLHGVSALICVLNADADGAAVCVCLLNKISLDSTCEQLGFAIPDLKLEV